ncbi:MAG: hypothetical protein MRY83_22810 [Flavobacteriales bacterium]|nr:hypothetical protein [Flavobacteriales bacterium]
MKGPSFLIFLCVGYTAMAQENLVLQHRSNPEKIFEIPYDKYFVKLHSFGKWPTMGMIKSVEDGNLNLRVPKRGKWIKWSEQKRFKEIILNDTISLEYRRHYLDSVDFFIETSVKLRDIRKLTFVGRNFYNRKVRPWIVPVSYALTAGFIAAAYKPYQQLNRSENVENASRKFYLLCAGMTAANLTYYITDTKVIKVKKWKIMR